MKKTSLSLTLATALSAGCGAQSPELQHQPPAVDLPFPGPAPRPLVNETPEKRPQAPEPVIEITEAMRWRLFNNNKCGLQNWEKCGKEVNRLFFDLTKLIPKAKNSQCMAAGDYEPGCVEAAYQEQYGQDQLLSEFKQQQEQCENNYNHCTARAEAECSTKCWDRIKQELEEKERELQKAEEEMPKY